MSDLQRAAGHLSRALQFATVSHQDSRQVDWPVFTAFEKYLEEAYPLVHQNLEKTVVNEHGLVFRWKGRKSEESEKSEGDEKSILLTAHYDVVPADSEGWPYPPFSGEIHDEKIYGRGSFDDKGSLIAILEAVTSLLEEGFVPPCDITLAFGFDEEVGGALGAQKIAAWMETEGLYFDHVLDEGGAVADGSMMGIEKPVAVIGVAEKGNSSFVIHFEGEGGHSSTPPKETAVSTMARFIREVQSKPAKPRLTPTVKAMLKATAPFRPGIQRFILAHPDLFAPLLIKILQKNRQTAAMLRTTTSFTMAAGGVSHNVLPVKASCTVNLRILQGDSVAQALQRFRDIGLPFQVEAILQEEPTAASQLEGPAMEHLCSSIASIFPEAVITPYLMVGGTDCRHYARVCRNAYRFEPARVSEKELSLMHGKGEYLSLKNLQTMVEFYETYIRTLA